MKVYLIEQIDERMEPRWEWINWRNVERNVRRLQERIYRATEKIRGARGLSRVR